MQDHSALAQALRRSRPVAGQMWVAEIRPAQILALIEAGACPLHAEDVTRCVAALARRCEMPRLFYFRATGALRVRVIREAIDYSRQWRQYFEASLL